MIQPFILTTHSFLLHVAVFVNHKHFLNHACSQKRSFVYRYIWIESISTKTSLRSRDAADRFGTVNRSRKILFCCFHLLLYPYSCCFYCCCCGFLLTLFLSSVPFEYSVRTSPSTLSQSALFGLVR